MASILPDALNQENAPLIFLLLGGGLPAPMYFGPRGVVKPENIVYSRVARGAVTNTEGSAFLDDFGQGVGRITVQGNTGWQGDNGITGWGLLNIKALQALFIDYLARRQAIAGLGLPIVGDPSVVSLLLFDMVNLQASLVYPTELTTAKDRSRPLLYNYRLSLIILSDLMADLIGALEIPDPLNQLSPFLNIFTQGSLFTSPVTGTIASSIGSGLISSLKAVGSFFEKII